MDRFAANDLVDLVARQRLVFEQRLRVAMQLVHMLGQDAARLVLALLDEMAGFLVDQRGGVIGYVLALRHRMTEEHLLLVVGIAKPAELVAETELGAHPPGIVRRDLDVLRRARRDVLLARSEFLGDAPAEGADRKSTRLNSSH